ncbi:MAG: FAD-dependent oxidoreductase [Armatimonadetes bacterium]|nr:FAD-dependent oxidoreductase [Armatimonadota bacterium]
MSLLSYIIESERKTPIAAKVDVVVAGGGPAGVVAAVAAARNGADTILMERYGFLGGASTASLVGPTLTFHNKKGQVIVRGRKLWTI